MILRSLTGFLPHESGVVFGSRRTGIAASPRAAPHVVQNQHHNIDEECSVPSTSEPSDGHRLPGDRRRVSKLQIKLHRQAKGLQSQGKLEGALSVLYQGLSLFPHDMHMLSLAASMELKIGNVNRAEKLLQEGLQHAPMHSTLLVVSGLLHACRGSLDEARECFQLAHDREPPKAATVLQVRHLITPSWAYLKITTLDQFLRSTDETLITLIQMYQHQI